MDWVIALNQGISNALGLSGPIRLAVHTSDQATFVINRLSRMKRGSNIEAEMIPRELQPQFPIGTILY